MSWKRIKSRHEKRLEKKYFHMSSTEQNGSLELVQVRKELLDIRAKEVGTAIGRLEGGILNMDPRLMTYKQNQLNCHVNVILDIIHIIFDRGLGGMFYDTPQGILPQMIHNARARRVDMGALSDLTRTFVCGTEKNDPYSLTLGHGRHGFNGSVHGPLLMIFFNRGANMTNQECVSFQLQDRISSTKRTIPGCMSINGAMTAHGAVLGYLNARLGITCYSLLQH